MPNILLGATGSVASVRVPLLLEKLQVEAFQVKAVATKSATYFFDPQPWREILTLDSDEWPGERYSRGDAVQHIELRRWADLFVIAPLDANTLAKLALGLSDNCLTCIWRAWDWAKPVVLAPAMNTLMWEHPFTRKHLRALAADFGAAHIPSHFDEMTLVKEINARAKKLRIAEPISKELACGDIGMGAMAEVDMIVQAVKEMLAQN